MGQTRKKNKKQPALLSPPIPEKCSSSKQHAEDLSANTDWWSGTVIVLNGGYGSLVRSNLLLALGNSDIVQVM